MKTISEVLIEESKKYVKPLTNIGLQLLVHNVAHEIARLHVKAALESVKNLSMTKYHVGESGYLTEEDYKVVYPETNIK